MEEPCYKFMLKHDIKKYLRQFKKTLSIFSSEMQLTQT